MEEYPPARVPELEAQRGIVEVDEYLLVEDPVAAAVGLDDRVVPQQRRSPHGVSLLHLHQRPLGL